MLPSYAITRSLFTKNVQIMLQAAVLSLPIQNLNSVWMKMEKLYSVMKC